jgi:hypothetical protein
MFGVFDALVWVALTGCPFIATYDDELKSEKLFMLLIFAILLWIVFAYVWLFVAIVPPITVDPYFI